MILDTRVGARYSDKDTFSEFALNCNYGNSRRNWS